MKWGCSAKSWVFHLARQVESCHHGDLSYSGIWGCLGCMNKLQGSFFFLRLSLQGYSWWYWRRRWASEWAIQSFSPNTSLVRKVSWSNIPEIYPLRSFKTFSLFYPWRLVSGPFPCMFFCLFLFIYFIFCSAVLKCLGSIIKLLLCDEHAWQDLFSSVLTVLSAGSLLPLHGRESYSWADPRGRGGQHRLWQWWEPHPFCHQENHNAPSPHWPLWGKVKNKEVFWNPASIQVLILVVTVVFVDWLLALWEKLLQRARGAQQLERNSSDWVKTEVEFAGEESCSNSTQQLYMTTFQSLFLDSSPCFRYLALLLQSLLQVLPILALMNSLCTKSASLSTLSPHPFSVRYSVCPSNIGQEKEV